MQIGIIDLGSNTIRLVIYNWNGRKLEKKKNIKRQTQSAKYISQGQMSRIGVEAIIEHVKELLMIARTFDVMDTHIFATASLRNIENSSEVKIQIENAIGQSIDVLNGEEESLFGFEGMKRTLHLPLKGISVDVGGGSTEITYFQNDRPIHSISIPIGSLNLYLSYVEDVLPTDGEMMLMRLEIHKYLNEIEWLQRIIVDELIGIGGSSRAIMRLHQNRHDLQASIYDFNISQMMIREILSEAAIKTPNIAQDIIASAPERLTTLIPGTLILYELMKHIGAETFKLSPYGVREGYLFKRILKDPYAKTL